MPIASVLGVARTSAGWVNGKKVLDKVAAAWGANPGDALPNLYIGGDLAELIVYARMLGDQERMQVEDYLAKKYGVTVAR